MLFSSNKKEVISVEGMHCAHCKARVEKAALSVEGIKSANADLSSGTLKLTISDGAADNVVSMVADAVNACGFKAKV